MFRKSITIATKTFLLSLFFIQLFSSQINAGLIPNSWLNSLVLIECQKEKNYIPMGTGFFGGEQGIQNIGHKCPCIAQGRWIASIHKD